MAEDTIITWNVANWITVVLMAAIGFALLAVVQKWYATKRSAENAAN